MIVVKTFHSDKEIVEWGKEEKNLDDLKKEYPPSSFNAKIDLINKQLIVIPKENAKQN